MHSGKLYVVRVGKNLESSQNSNSILISQFIYLFLLAMQIFVLIHPLVSPKIAKKSETIYPVKRNILHEKYTYNIEGLCGQVS